MKSKGWGWLIVGIASMAGALIVASVVLVVASFAGLGGTSSADTDSSGGAVALRGPGADPNGKIFKGLPNSQPGNTSYAKPDVPKKFVSFYEHAAAKWKLGPYGPAILAAIHSVESNYAGSGGGGTSSAGAQGPMQFLPGTWAGSGDDCNGDGKKDINNVEDAICGAARYLHSSGAPKNWRKAIFAYNHADWYVNGVLFLAREILRG